MKTTYPIFLYLILSSTTAACGQETLFYKHIAPVIFKSCTPCHQRGAIGPFTLETYDDVKYHAKMISYVLEERLMPPWKADDTYRTFHNERKIDSGFLGLFLKWMNGGYAQGNDKISFSAPSGEDLVKPDYIIRMPRPIKLEATNRDIFVTYIDSMFLGGERYIKSIKIVPGNTRLVHHCRVDFDTTDASVSLLKDGFINTANLNTIPPPAYGFVADYVPGISAYKYPEGIGYKVSKKLYVLVNVHYAPNAKEEYDSTKVYVYFYPKGYKPREVGHRSIGLDPKTPNVEISKIPKDSICTFQIGSEALDTSISLIAIQPHMHLIGKYMEVYAITPANDTVPLVRVTDWDFNWQENYYFEKPVVLPKGTTFHIKGIYDNTTGNLNNPFYPPQDIYFNNRMKTTNEMFEFYIQSVIYRPGDEKLELYK